MRRSVVSFEEPSRSISLFIAETLALIFKICKETERAKTLNCLSSSTQNIKYKLNLERWR